MEPALQRLGDVTIQRVEKPKSRTEEDGESPKRQAEAAGPSNSKRVKLDLEGATQEKKNGEDEGDTADLQSLLKGDCW